MAGGNPAITGNQRAPTRGVEATRGRFQTAGGHPAADDGFDHKSDDDTGDEAKLKQRVTEARTKNQTSAPFSEMCSILWLVHRVLTVRCRLGQSIAAPFPSGRR